MIMFVHFWPLLYKVFEMYWTLKIPPNVPELGGSGVFGFGWVTDLFLIFCCGLSFVVLGCLNVFFCVPLKWIFVGQNNVCCDFFLSFNCGRWAKLFS